MRKFLSVCLCIEYSLFRQPIIIGQVKLYLTLHELNFEPINNFYLVILSKKKKNLYLVMTSKMRRKKKTFSIFWLMSKICNFGKSQWSFNDWHDLPLSTSMLYLKKKKINQVTIRGQVWNWIHTYKTHTHTI